MKRHIESYTEERANIQGKKKNGELQAEEKYELKCNADVRAY